MRNLLLYILFLFLIGSAQAQSAKNKKSKSVKNDDRLIADLMAANPEHFSHILKNASIYDIQIIYTQIDHNVNGKPELTSYTYHLNDKKYFYPASLVKLPLCVFSIEQCESYNIPISSPMFTFASGPCQYNVFTDSSSIHYKPSIENYIKKMMLVSDNDAYSRAFEWLTPDSIQKQLKNHGFNLTIINHRFDAACKNTDNLFYNRIAFTNEKGDTLLVRNAGKCKPLSVHPLGKVKKGKGYKTNAGKLVRKPKDFTQMNYMPLAEIHNFLVHLMYPATCEADKQTRLNSVNREILLKAMSSYPRESIHPSYPADKYEDSYKKYLLLADYHDTIRNDSLRIFNVVGQSYGWLADVAYFVDFKNKVDFFLSAVIYVNKDNILNDGKYEYKSIGFPFLSNLGRLIYDYDAKRKRKTEPDLKSFRFKYP